MGRVYNDQYYTKKMPDGTRKRVYVSGWYIEHTDATGRTVRRKGGLSEAQAKDSLRQAESEVLAVKNGIPTRSAGDILMRELQQRYLASLKTRASDGHSKRVEAYIRELVTACRFYSVKDLIPDRVEIYLDQIATEDNLGSTAINARLDAINAMLAWSVRARIIPYNPLDCIDKRELDRKYIRRALAEDEISNLLAAALDGPRRRRMKIHQNRPRKDGSFKPYIVPLFEQAHLARAGRGIALTYRLMLEAGLRVNEVRCLQWPDVDFATGILHARAIWTKNGKDEDIPLTPGLNDALTRWKAEHETGTQKVTGAVVKITSRTLDRFKDDLDAAGIKTPDSAGRVVDLHALRHTFGTRLGRMPGIDPKTVQTLMRHADPRITFCIYVHSDKNRLLSAVNLLPALKPATPKSESSIAVALKSGTHDEKIEAVPPSFRQGISSGTSKALSKNEVAGNREVSSHPRGQGFESLSAHI